MREAVASSSCIVIDGAKLIMFLEKMQTEQKDHRFQEMQDMLYVARPSVLM
jgi:hypothetical protein